MPALRLLLRLLQSYQVQDVAIAQYKRLRELRVTSTAGAVLLASGCVMSYALNLPIRTSLTKDRSNTTAGFEQMQVNRKQHSSNYSHVSKGLFEGGDPFTTIVSGSLRTVARGFKETLQIDAWSKGIVA